MGLAGNGTICNLVATHFFQRQNAPAYFWQWTEHYSAELLMVEILLALLTPGQ